MGQGQTRRAANSYHAEITLNRPDDTIGLALMGEDIGAAGHLGVRGVVILLGWLTTNAHCVLVDVDSHSDICHGRFSVG